MWDLGFLTLLIVSELLLTMSVRASLPDDSFVIATRVDVLIDDNRLHTQAVGPHESAFRVLQMMCGGASEE